MDIFGKKKKKNGVKDADSRQAGPPSPPHARVTPDKMYGDMLCSPSVVLVCLSHHRLPLHCHRVKFFPSVPEVPEWFSGLNNVTRAFTGIAVSNVPFTVDYPFKMFQKSCTATLFALFLRLSCRI